MRLQHGWMGVVDVSQVPWLLGLVAGWGLIVGWIFASGLDVEI